MSFTKHLYQSLFWRILYYLSLLLLTIIIARYYEASLSGWFNYLISFAGLFVLISGLSLESAIGFYCSKENADISSFILFIFFWCILIALIGVAVIFILYYYGIKLDGQFLFISLLIYIVGNLLISFTQSVFIARYNFKICGLVSIIFNLSLIALLFVTTILKQRVDLSLFIIIYSSSFFIQGLLLWYILIKKYNIKMYKGILFPFSKPLFHYALPAFIGNLIFFLVYRIDYFFVHKFCDDTMLGNYIQVSKMAQLFLIIPASIAAVIFPATAKGEPGIEQKMKAISRFLVSFFLIVITILVLSGKWLFPWLFGNSFNKMYQTFLPLIPGILSLVIISILGAYFAGKDLVRINLIGAFLALIIIVSIDLLLIPVLQIRGAAIACSISYTSYLAYLLFWFSRTGSTRISNMFIITKSDFDLVKNILFISKYH